MKIPLFGLHTFSILNYIESEFHAAFISTLNFFFLYLVPPAIGGMMCLPNGAHADFSLWIYYIVAINHTSQLPSPFHSVSMTAAAEF